MAFIDAVRFLLVCSRPTNLLMRSFLRRLSVGLTTSSTSEWTLRPSTTLAVRVFTSSLGLSFSRLALPRWLRQLHHARRPPGVREVASRYALELLPLGQALRRVLRQHPGSFSLPPPSFVLRLGPKLSTSPRRARRTSSTSSATAPSCSKSKSSAPRSSTRVDPMPASPSLSLVRRLAPGFPASPPTRAHRSHCRG